MALTKQEIQEVGFEHSLRGYDVAQVDVFLERVAVGVDEMATHIANLETQLDGAKKELAAAHAQLAEQEENPQADPAALEQATLAERELKAELEAANDRLAAATIRADEAEAKIAALTEQLEEKNRLDSAIAEAFIAAQRSADQIRESARAEGDRIYRESEAKAREFIRESLAKKAAIDSEIESLEASAEKFRTQYLEMLERFTAHAQEEFECLDTYDVSDERVDAELPDIDSMPGFSAKDEPVKLEDDDLPRLTTQQIPQINIPSVRPEDDE